MLERLNIGTIYRRHYLAALGAVGVAGCSGSAPNTEAPPTDTPPPTDGDGGPTRTPTDIPTEPPTDTPTETPTDSATPTPTVGYEIERADLVVQEGEFSTDRGAIVEVTNTADTVGWGWVVRAAFVDDSETVLDTDETRLFWLDPGNTWRAHLSYYSTEDKASAVQADVTEVTPTTFEEIPDKGASAEGIDLLESTLEPPSDGRGPQAVGRVQNNRDSDLSYLQAFVQFRDGNYARGRGFDNVTNLPARSAWEYSTRYTTASIEDASEISDFTTIASTR